jgi:hypothetical protein
MEIERKPVVVSIKYQFPNEDQHHFEIIDNGPADINYVSAVAEKSNESYEYSGRHDQGKLPTIRSEGSMSRLVAALQETKKVSDKFLSARINEVYGYASNKMDEDEVGENEETGGGNIGDEESDDKIESQTKRMKVEKKQPKQQHKGKGKKF